MFLDDSQFFQEPDERSLIGVCGWLCRCVIDTVPTPNPLFGLFLLLNSLQLLSQKQIFTSELSHFHVESIDVFLVVFRPWRLELLVKLIH